VAAVAGLSGTRAASQQPAGPAPVCDLRTTDRIVAVGDIHGALDRFVAILTEAKLIDGRRRWIGGRAVLVQTGDILDRGADSRAVLDLLRKLEGEAARAGGRVQVLLGNHEVMRLLQINRDVSAGEYAAFKTFDSTALRDNVFNAYVSQEQAKARTSGARFDERAFREKFLAETPLGFIEMRLAFEPTGEYGRWLRGLPVVVKVNDIVFVHGGVSAAVAPQGCTGINSMAKAELQALKATDAALQESLVGGPSGPLWYRGFFLDPLAPSTDVDTILTALGAKAMVVGHTVGAESRIRAHYDNRIFQIDTGMLGGTFFPNGVASALEINGQTVTAIYEKGQRETIVK
jgi:hypothetical protein